MMKRIPLTQGKFAIVDDEDYKELSKHKWHTFKNSYGGYAAIRNCQCLFDKKRRVIYMHRQIMSCPQEMEIDHQDHNQLNNRKSNLRICTRAENQRNRNKQKNNTSGFKRVYRRKDCKKWRANIGFNGQQIHLGDFNSAIEAAKIYDKKAKELFGEFAKTNF